MRSLKRKLFTVATLLICVICGGAVVYCGGQSNSKDEEITLLTIGTADSGGSMYPVGTAIADILSENNAGLKINLSASSGSAANAQGLTEGQIDLGLISGDIALCAYEGKDSFQGESMKNLRVIAAVYSSMSNWIALENSKLTYVNELKGLTLAVGPQGSTTEISARVGLSPTGLNSDNCDFESYSLSSGSTALQGNVVDAVHGFAGVPISAFEELSRNMDMQLLQYTQGELNSILAQNPGYSEMVIPAGTYHGQMQDVHTFGVKCLLCVDETMDEALVYEITKTLVEVVQTQGVKMELMSEMADISFVCENLSIPLHSGAQKYYQERMSETD